MHLSRRLVLSVLALGLLLAAPDAQGTALETTRPTAAQRAALITLHGTGKRGRWPSWTCWKTASEGNRAVQV